MAHDYHVIFKTLANFSCYHTVPTLVLSCRVSLFSSVCKAYQLFFHVYDGDAFGNHMQVCLFVFMECFLIWVNLILLDFLYAFLPEIW